MKTWPEYRPTGEDHGTFCGVRSRWYRHPPVRHGNHHRGRAVASRMSPTARRHARLVLVSLIAGVLLTWVVAWVGALAPSTTAPWRDDANEEQAWAETRSRVPTHTQPTTRGDMIVAWRGWAGLESVMLTPLWSSRAPHRAPEHWDFMLRRWEEIPAAERAAYSRSSPDLPSWVVFPPEFTEGHNFHTNAAGWPMPALSYSATFHSKPFRMVAHGALDLRGPNEPHERLVPVTPMPLGFVVDTIVWACIFAGVVLGAGRARGWLRRRRGLCPGCAYQLAGLPSGATCPECGRRPREPGNKIVTSSRG